MNSRGNLKDIAIPKKSEELAELVGIILGDGNLNFYQKGKSICSYLMRICGHMNEDKSYLNQYVAPLVEKLFKVKPYFYVQKTFNSMHLIVSRKKLVIYLQSIGLKSGNKVKHNVRIPYWIRSNKNYLSCCLRGLMDTDGSIFRMSNRDPHLLRLQFKNYSQRLLEDSRDAFTKLGYSPNKICNHSFSISSQNQIRRYIAEIGFKNPKHLKRLFKLSI